MQPTTTNSPIASEQELKHLDLLSTFHYVLGAITGLFACFPILHIIMGITFIIGLDGAEIGDKEGAIAAHLMGWIFVIMGSILVLAGWLVATLMVVTGINLKKRKRYTFCMVTSAIECTFMPFGTVLGILTIVMLSKPHIKALFSNENTAQS